MTHSCAVLATGRVKCWGGNSNGQLGDGTQSDADEPVAVVGLSDITAVNAGGAHTCAISKAGAVWCWGWNYSGQLGDGTKIDRLKPVSVIGF